MFWFRFITSTVFSFMFNVTGHNLDIELNRGFRCRCCWCSSSWWICHIRLGDSSCLFSDTTLEWILGMATVYVAVVEGLNSSGFLGFEFLYIISTPRCVFRCNSSLSSFAFNKKATKCEWLLLLEGSGIKRVVFMWGSSFYVEKGLVG